MWKCGICGATLIWGADFDYEDYGLDGEGIVSTYTCPDCGATVEVYVSDEDKK